MDRSVVGNVVSHILLRRGKDRGKPYCVDADGLDVWNLADDARYITQAVAIAIFEAGGIDLIAVNTSVMGMTYFFSYDAHTTASFHQAFSVSLAELALVAMVGGGDSLCGAIVRQMLEMSGNSAENWKWAYSSLINSQGAWRSLP